MKIFCKWEQTPDEARNEWWVECQPYLYLFHKDELGPSEFNFCPFCGLRMSEWEYKEAD